MTDHGAGMGNSIGAIDAAEQASISDRLRGAGLTQVSCLLAWLQCLSAERRGLRATSFTELAPTEELYQIVLEVLQVCEFVVAGKPGRSLLRTAMADHRAPWRSQDWMLDPSLGPEHALLDACEAVASELFSREGALSEAADMWRILALAECSSYLTAELEEHHLDSRWAAIAEPAITKIIEHVPISQAFYICWLGVRDIASAYLKYPNSRDILGTTLRSSLEQKIGRAQSEGWILRNFNRHPFCPESALARVFSSASGLNDAYLHAVPRLESIARYRA